MFKNSGMYFQFVYGIEADPAISGATQAG